MVDTPRTSGNGNSVYYWTKLLSVFVIGEVILIRLGFVPIIYLYSIICMIIFTYEVLSRGGLEPIVEQLNLLRDGENQKKERSEEEILSIVQERYAQGEISDEEFEHHIERLLNTELSNEVGSEQRELQPSMIDQDELSSKNTYDKKNKLNI
ncbi:SHOCT domain-containing protein [Halocatena halophila]|uniref:SHOCT domain-containing protein n=1 Tax=Halocatena halophila TaxID=2814576 RepID=UPI002ED1CBBC